MTTIDTNALVMAISAPVLERIGTVTFASGDVMAGDEFRQLMLERLYSMPSIGSDSLVGTEGDDTMDGLAGSDTLMGGAGNDRLSASANGAYGQPVDRDVLYGEQGSDVLIANPGTDVTMFGGDGDDELRTLGAGDGSMSGGDGDDRLSSLACQRDMHGDAGNDTLTSGEATLAPGSLDFYGARALLDNSMHSSSVPTRRIDGDDGDDTLVTYRTGDWLIGGAGSDVYEIGVAAWRVGLDARAGDAGMDILKLPEGFTLENVMLAPDVDGHMCLTTSGGVQTIAIELVGSTFGQIGRIVFADGRELSADVLMARYNVTTSASDGLLADGTGQTLSAQAGDDILVDIGGANQLDGGEGNDALYSLDEQQSSTLIGGAGNDLLYGDLEDTLLGGGGDDTLVSSIYGSPVMDGGEGDDLLREANGVVVFGHTSGHDTVESGYVDVLRFDASVRPEDVMYFGALQLGEQRVTRYFELKGSGARLELKDAVHLANYQGTRVAFESTGQVFKYDDYLASNVYQATGAVGEVVTGSDLADELRGSSVADQLVGLVGNDRLNGGLGNDVLQGGDGNDVLWGERGQDSLYGGAGGDWIDAEATSRWGNGTDYYGRELSGDLVGDVVDAGADQDTVRAGSFDTVDAGTGDDLVEWRAGSQGTVLKVSEGFGHDRVKGFDAGTGVVHWNVGQDDLRVVWERLQADITLTSGAGDELLLAGLATKVQTLRDYAPARPADFETRLVVQFGDGTGLTWAQLAALTTRGRESDDVILGNEWSQTLSGEGGNDELRGTARDETLLGGLGRDTLRGGAGNDTLDGGGDADTLGFDAGDGQDLIHADGQDVIVLGAGLNRSELQIGRLDAGGSNSVTLSFNGRTDALTLDQAGQWDGLQVQFADGSRISGAQILVEATRHLDRTLTGTQRRDTLVGLDGNDTLSGFGGNDVLSGGRGQDLLVGGQGGDTYQFFRGDGQDTVVESGWQLFSQDVLAFQDASSSQLWFARSGRHLEISILGTQDKVILKDWYAGAFGGVEQITAADGQRLSALRVESLVQSMATFTPPAGGEILPTTVSPKLSHLVDSAWR
ncbi:MAG TPA: calcium-binding protein [Aquabacterium sp.]|uniref:calcium-binding protein n=1 Tax=Aquabacterium sp. TaxID=1872578 RepID=UPI002E30355B|nr:calcium-binding protein [Aquabacterium sp.]HEX5373456.1 calcium-binding protein [Aquabacterium sp.]